MVRPRRLLLGMTLAMTLGVSGAAGADDPPATESVAGLLSGSTVTCSAALPSGTTACWWEKRILTLGDFEVAVAVDAAVTFNTGEWYVSPMFSVAWYGPTGFARRCARHPQARPQRLAARRVLVHVPVRR